MRRLILIFAAMLCIAGAFAQKYSYRFNRTHLADALTQIAGQHPDLHINFIYNELDKYPVTSNIYTNDAYDMLRQLIGLNPVSVIRSGGRFYVEAFQHGKFCYRGRVLDEEYEPAPGTTIMLLAPKDSTVITYGVADNFGRFTIPCDSRNVIAKLSCVGYKTTYRRLSDFNVGDIILPIDAVALQQVKVEGQMASAYSDRTVYLPSSRQKNAAQNATALLSMMSIPQISVDPITQEVRTSFGEGVSIFINYVPATTEDLKGMRTQDAKRVEFYQYPSDVRFQGARYVINFIMQEYEWGGYTKINAVKSFGINRTEGSVYSKMAYKRMTFDVYADESYLTSRHIGQRSIEEFNFTDFYGQGLQSVTRNTETTSSRYRSNDNNLSVRARYSTDKVDISNRVAYSLSSNPHNDLSNRVSYSSDMLPASTSATTSSSHNWALNYNGNFNFTLSKQAVLNATAAYTYGRNEYYSHYSVPDELSITNNADENVHKLSSYLHLYWNPNSSNNFNSNFGIEHNWNIIDYSGNSPSKQIYNVGVYFLSQTYQHIFNEKWRAGVEFAWIWETNRISGVNADNNFPQTNINATWSPNNKNQLYFAANYGSMFANSSQKSPNMLQQDELIWYKGNPHLKDYNYTNAYLVYTWLPNNKWQLTSTAYFGYIRNRLVTLYSPTGPDGTMLREYFNGGDYFSNYLSINATGKFLDGKLVAQLTPYFWIRKAKETYAWNDNEFICTAQLTYFLGNFYFMGWYSTPSKYQEVNSGIISRTPARYQLEIGWGNGVWNISVKAYNFAHTGWDDYKESLTSKYYSFDRTTFGTQYHARYSLSVTYTIGYGKKVQRNNETSGSGTAGSAILK